MRARSSYEAKGEAAKQGETELFIHKMLLIQSRMPNIYPVQVYAGVTFFGRIGELGRNVIFGKN